MNLIDLLQDAGAKDSMGAIASKLNLDSSQTNSVVTALAPALMRSLQNQAKSPGGLQALAGALETGGHQRYVEEPAVLESPVAVEDGNRILGHLFGSKDVSRNVAARASEESGVDQALIKKALPLVAGLAMGALSKQSDSGRSVGTMLSGLLAGDDNEFGIDDVLSLARRFF